MPKGHGKLIWQRNARDIIPIEERGLQQADPLHVEDAAGQATAVSGIVSVPPGEPPKRGWPVITWAHGTTGIAEPARPSRVTRRQPGRRRT